MFENFNKIRDSIYEANKAKGFHEETRSLGEELMLITGELAKCLEADRKNRKANAVDYRYNETNIGEEFPKVQPLVFEECIKDSVEDEIADAMIRIFDLCGAKGVDIAFHVEEKLKYNKTRKYKHGKEY
jgi:NTP pyrophosphatase (non-canonical NTP hydrolase)